MTSFSNSLHKQDEPRDSKLEGRAEFRGEQMISARNEQGQFVSLGSDRQREQKEFKENGSKDFSRESGKDRQEEKPDMGNMLRHIENLEAKLAQSDKHLSEAHQRVEKFSARTREGMQSALDSLMKKWMDAVETKDDKHKEQFKNGMQDLVKNSAEENGVWQMMVAASALHQRQEHDLDKLRGENNTLKEKIDGSYATASSRTSNALGKRKADTEPMQEPSVEDDNLWSSFANGCSNF